MDFEKLLRVARKNELNKKEPVKCLPTRFKPPTKEQHEKDKLLSEGVQKFLARREQEEKKKQLEAEKRRQELMALRAKDPKANKRIQTMLKRTKSANKSVMEDAVDNNNTADTLAGPSQPDEDDYGFVSETSQQLYNNLIQKMYSTPSNDLPKFSPIKKPTGNNLLNTKERVKLALLKQEEEEKLPHKRRRKGKEKPEDEDDTELVFKAPDRDLSKPEPEPNKDKVEKPKVKRPPPPPVDFHELLKIAERKQHEPVVFEPKVKKPQEPEVLMTKKQKLEHEKMMEWKRQRELRLQNLENGQKSANSKQDKKPIPRIPKVNDGSSGSPSTSQSKTNGEDNKPSGNKVAPKTTDKGKEKIAKSSQLGLERKVPLKPRDTETDRLIKERDEALRMLKEKERLIRERDEAFRLLKEKEQLIKERDEAVRKLKALEENEKVKNSVKSSQATKSHKNSADKEPVKNAEHSKSDSSKKEGGVVGSKTSTNSAVKKLSSVPTPSGTINGSRPREFPPKDMKSPITVKNSSGDRRGNLQRSKQFPPGDVRRKPLTVRKGRIESDDEYDSELEDFIDDDDHDMDSEEVSKVISEIFKYNKNKYSKYDDADDECMESNYAQISKEEFFSTKCGILEDLKDIQREKAKLAKKQKR